MELRITMVLGDGTANGKIFAYNGKITSRSSIKVKFLTEEINPLLVATYERLAAEKAFYDKHKKRVKMQTSEKAEPKRRASWVSEKPDDIDLNKIYTIS